MKVAGLLLAGALLAGLYVTWGPAWQTVLAAGVVGVVLTQAGHSTGWREIFTTAGSALLFATLIGVVFLLFQLFMS